MTIVGNRTGINPQARNKAVFLDRDGVINLDRGYVYRPENFRFIEGVFAACRHLQRCGYLLVVVTNQSGIARGLFSETDFQTLTAWMLAQLNEQGVEIASVYHCPHHPEYGPAHTRHCLCRKPAPGMLLRAMAELNIDPAASIMLGDKGSDLEAATAAGINRKVLVRSGQMVTPEIEALADEIWTSLGDATNMVA